tara:strand:- start:845 stop:1081 length:237 start_codon:yes stop_codon:yes gene_type:complete
MIALNLFFITLATIGACVTLYGIGFGILWLHENIASARRVLNDIRNAHDGYALGGSGDNHRGDLSDASFVRFHEANNA